MSPLHRTKLIDSFRQAPLAWAGAAVFAALPLAVVAFKQPAPTAPEAPKPAHLAAMGSASGGVSDWFSGPDNPFLTEEQARDRRLRAALGRVEEVLRRRPDVREVTVLTSGPIDGRGAPAGAVVSIHMREGVVPIPLVDAAGTLLTAAVPGLRAQDVTVIDETTGIRARAAPMDDELAAHGREALAAARRTSATVTPPAPTQTVTVEPAGREPDPWPAWAGVAVALGAASVAVFAYLWRMRRMHADTAETMQAEDPFTGTLSMALHRGVAEQGALIATALVERLEQGSSPGEVAQLLLSLEPWAAERLLKGMPPEALAKVEEALRDPAGEAPSTSVRALAEAVLSVRSAA